MKHIIGLFLAGLLTVPVCAQQLPQLSQYQFNDYVFNPAIAGSRPFFEFRSGHRYQWVGITDAPRTFVLSGTSPVGRRMGLGGYIYTDIVGPTRRTGAQFSYAYHLGLTEDLKLSLAVSGGVLQYLVDGSKITFNEADDPVLDDQLRGDLVPDAKFGLYLYHPKFWFGAAAPQLVRNKIHFFSEQDETLSKLSEHYYATAGYRLALGDDVVIEPSVMAKYVSPVPVKIDGTLTIKFMDAFWIAGTYRTNDAISVMAGYWFKKSFQFGYSYDITNTNLSGYSQGTHEVMLGITFGKQAPEPRDKQGDAQSATPEPE